MEHSILAQRYVIVPLGSPGATVLVRYPAVLHYPGIQDLSNQVSGSQWYPINYARVIYL